MAAVKQVFYVVTHDAEGKSIFAHDPKGKVAAAYEQFTREVLAVEKQRAKNAVGLAR